MPNTTVLAACTPPVCNLAACDVEEFEKPFDPWTKRVRRLLLVRPRAGWIEYARCGTRRTTRWPS